MCVVVTALGAQLSSPHFETPYQQNEEMDEFTAAMREATDAAGTCCSVAVVTLLVYQF